MILRGNNVNLKRTSLEGNSGCSGTNVNSCGLWTSAILKDFNLAAGSVSGSDSVRFCDILARHLTVDNNPSLGEFLIVSVQTLIARGLAFYDAALKS
jgi:hypothetical protein